MKVKSQMKGKRKKKKKKDRNSINADKFQDVTKTCFCFL
jgi:hypothetical protein